MASFFRNLWVSLSGKATERDEPSAEPVEYKGYRIRPAPYPSKGQYQTAGVIEKIFGAETKEHRFVRAETHASKDDAVSFSIAKAKQIIDEQGDRIFP
jgi:hypothetical protein